jgi:hypothetical protein
MLDFLRSLEKKSRFRGIETYFPHIDIQTHSHLGELSPSYETSECGCRNAKL